MVAGIQLIGALSPPFVQECASSKHKHRLVAPYFHYKHLCKCTGLVEDVGGTSRDQRSCVNQEAQPVTTAMEPIGRKSWITMWWSAPRACGLSFGRDSPPPRKIMECFYKRAVIHRRS